MIYIFLLLTCGDFQVAGYLNNEEEQRLKKVIWEDLNWEYLQVITFFNGLFLIGFGLCQGTNSTKSLS